MSQYDYDLFIIGGGSAGVRAARQAAASGKRVALAERGALGGTCVNIGCVPKKLFVYASHFAETFEEAKGFGWDLQASSFDWPRLISNKNREILRLNGIYQRLLEASGVTILTGHASFTDSHHLVVNGSQYSAERTIIAVGTKPFVPQFPGSEHVISSDQAFYLKTLPKSVMVVGGGYIALEFAGIFNGLGVATSLVYRGERLLKAFDGTSASFATNQLIEKGIDVQLNQQIISVKSRDEAYEVEFESGQKQIVGLVMYATGRKPDFNDLGLDNTDVSYLDNGKIWVDYKDFCTKDAAVYALGDIIDSPELTPVALAEAMVFVNQAYGDQSRTIDYDNIPTAVFCQPNLATVGLSEDQAVAQAISHDVYETDFRQLKHTLTENFERSYMKMIVDKLSQRIIGMHMVGPDAGEIMQLAAVAIKAGLTKSQFDQTIGIHPTAAEEFVTLREVSRSN